jgi:hypothetical protein
LQLNVYATRQYRFFVVHTQKKHLVKELKCNSLDTLIEYIVINLSSLSYAMKFIAFKKEVLHFYQIY